MTRSAVAAALLLAAVLAVESHAHARDSQGRAGLSSAAARATACTLVAFNSSAGAECAHAPRDAVTAAAGSAGKPRVELLDGCEAAAQLGQQCSADDGPVLAIDY